MESLNEFETVILEHIAKHEPVLQKAVCELRVTERRFTGCGSYTDFEKESVLVNTSKSHYSLKELILMPKIENGMGATLFVEDGYISFLEIYVFGGKQWDGTFKGFSLNNNE